MPSVGVAAFTRTVELPALSAKERAALPVGGAKKSVPAAAVQVTGWMEIFPAVFAVVRGLCKKVKIKNRLESK